MPVAAPASTATADLSDPIVEQHRGLRIHLDALWACAAAMPVDDDEASRWRCELAECLDVLRADLVVHFAHEETGGGFDELARQLPHAAAKLEALTREHAVILDMVARLLGVVAADTPSGLVAGTAQVVERLRRHEAAENELLLGAVADELGVGD
ncbi:MAG: hemerythrin domain-containing protein [Deltaproteobacteria bacterium]|nr:hemerythrin domain-containing protein [Deltaproteobacteria bacterium]